MKRNFAFIAFGLSALWLGGCTPRPVEVFMPPKTENVQDITFAADAGVRVDPSVYDFQAQGNASSIIARVDPWALRVKERAFEKSQLAANLLVTNSWYQMEYEEPPPRDEQEGIVPEEPQPNRRLAGVLIGETVTALIDMGDGQGMQLARPGTIFGEWEVASIDEEKAVLRRTNRNKRPFYVVVRLDSGSGGGSSSGSGNTGGGGRPGGNNGGPGTARDN